MIDKDTLELYELLVALHEGDMTEEQFSVLNSKLKQQDLVARYVEFISIFSDLSCPSTADLYFTRENEAFTAAPADQRTYIEIMKKFAEEENSAPAINVPQAKPQQELIQKVSRQKIVYQLNKRSLVIAMISAAAILLVVLFARFAPVRSGREVATLSDTINAKWANNYIPMNIGSRLMDTDPPFILREGYAELLFDNDAKIVVEGPAEFQLLTPKQVRLNYGKLYASISDEAYGFIICTKYSEIIDLGTEFGVQQSLDGDTELHVIKGRTNLISGAYGKVNLSVTAGSAKRFLGSSGEVKDVSCNASLFVRDIESKANLVWRGQETLDLADVICGGNGFGSGDPQTVIDPVTGNTQPYVERGFGTRYATSSYSKTESLRYVDGVFVPDGGDGPIVISSAGTVFESCPDTSGAVRKDISVLNKIYQKDGGELKLNDMAFGYPYRPAITMQANLGITFDLDAIRKAMEGFDISYFETLCAVASDTNEVYETVAEEKRPAGKADFWILIDGRLQKTQQGVQMGFSELVRIPIASQDRFLTIVTTDHMESGELDPIGWDRCFLGEPVLGFKSIGNL